MENFNCKWPFSPKMSNSEHLCYSIISNYPITACRIAMELRYVDKLHCHFSSTQK